MPKHLSGYDIDSGWYFKGNEKKQSFFIQLNITFLLYRLRITCLKLMCFTFFAVIRVCKDSDFALSMTEHYI